MTSLIAGLIIIMLFISRRGVKIPPRYAEIIRRESRDQRVPMDLITAIIAVESNWDELARGRDGEIGLMQILPATAFQMGFRGAPDTLFDPETNIHFGAKYLRWQLDRFRGSTDFAIAGYNAGTPRTRIDGKFTNQEYVDKVRAFL